MRCDTVPLLEIGQIAARNQATLMQDRHPLADPLDIGQDVGGEEDRDTLFAREAGGSARAASWRPIGSSPAVGSSSNRTRGSLMRAWASPTFWDMPEENEPSRSSATLERSNWSREAVDAPFERGSRQAEHGPDVAQEAPRRHLLRQPVTRREESRTGAEWRGCRRRCRGRARGPCPMSGRNSPSSIRSVVVLPAPLWPMKPNTSPTRTAKVTSSTATRLPKYFESPWIWIALTSFTGLFLLQTDRRSLYRPVVGLQGFRACRAL